MPRKLKSETKNSVLELIVGSAMIAPSIALAQAVAPELKNPNNAFVQSATNQTPEYAQKLIYVLDDHLDRIEISGITKDAVRSAKVNGNDDVEEFFAQATKDVVKNLPLSGVKRLNMYKSEDGTLYVQMVLKNEDYTKFLENSQKAFEARAAKSNLGRENINKTQAATKELFDELEKERVAEKPKIN